MNSTNIINKIKKEIKINKKLLEEANKIDIKYDNKKIEFTKIFEIIDYFLKISEGSISKTKVKEYVFIYYGDIYMTLYFALVAILINKKINLFMDEYLIGINNVLLEIINSVLKENKLDLINYSFGYKINEIKEIPDKEIFVIGNSTIYQEIYSLNNLRFIPFFNLIIYFDEHISQKKQELLDIIFYYAEENRFEFEVLDMDMEIEEIVEYSNKDIYSNIIFVLTDDEKKKNILKTKIRKKKLYLNSNPFKIYENKILECLNEMMKNIIK